MPTTGEPTTGLLITALTVSLLLGAAAGWAVRNVRWWVVMLLAAAVVGGGTAIAGGLTYSSPDHRETATGAVEQLAAAGLVTSGVCLGVTALLVSWFLCHRSVRRAAITAQRRRTGSAAHQARRRPPVAVRAGPGYIPRGAVVLREKP